MNPRLQSTLTQIASRPIPEDRKIHLQELITAIRAASVHESVRLNFICTHNSRRSHLGQVWLQTLAQVHKKQQFTAYSGGTEATAVAPQIIKTLSAQGFDIHALSEGSNPVYSIKYQKDSAPVIALSKTYDHPMNPSGNFIAIMTCSEADEGCPFIAGATHRVPLTYQDPKHSDGSPEEAATYAERSLQIATELNYVLTHL